MILSQSYDLTKGTQDKDFSYSFSDSLSLVKISHAHSLILSGLGICSSTSHSHNHTITHSHNHTLSHSHNHTLSHTHTITQSHTHTITHSHTLLITCTCCYGEIKGTPDQDFSCSFSDSLSGASLSVSCLSVLVPVRMSGSLACSHSALLHLAVLHLAVLHLLKSTHIINQPTKPHQTDLCCWKAAGASRVAMAGAWSHVLCVADPQGVISLWSQNPSFEQDLPPLVRTCLQLHCLQHLLATWAPQIDYTLEGGASVSTDI